jgi:hypothetical protein
MLFLFCLKHKKYLNSENFAVEACTRNNYRARTAAKPTANELFAARAKYSVIVVIKVRYWNIYLWKCCKICFTFDLATKIELFKSSRLFCVLDWEFTLMYKRFRKLKLLFDFVCDRGLVVSQLL